MHFDAFLNFDLKIKPYPLVPNRKLWKDSGELIQFLKVTHFVTQDLLEKLLKTFQMDYNGKEILLQNFWAPLEKESSTESPYWHLILETTWPRTPRFLSRKISESLYKTNALESLDSSIEIKVTDPIAKLLEEKRYMISKSDLNWSPDSFDKELLDCFKVLKNEERKKKIQMILDRDSL